jgi:hypothetical protein
MVNCGHSKKYNPTLIQVKKYTPKCCIGLFLTKTHFQKIHLIYI